MTDTAPLLRQEGTNGVESDAPVPTALPVRVTPDMALEWLDRNPRNRLIRTIHVETLAGAMLRGEWKLNGESIKISSDDYILDGQHRLWALVMAADTNPDVYFWTFVTTGLDPETQDTMDTGAKRVLADVLKMHGEVNTNVLAATLQRLHLWEQGESALRFAGSRRLSVAQALAKLDREPKIRDAIRAASRIRNQLGLSGGGRLSVPLLAACLYKFDELDHEDSVEFWRQVATGEDLHRYDPTYELRRHLISNSSSKRKLPTLVVHALIIKAWNAYREGRKIQLLAYKAGGKSQEKFPEPV